MTYGYVLTVIMYLMEIKSGKKEVIVALVSKKYRMLPPNFTLLTGLNISMNLKTKSGHTDN